MEIQQLQDTLSVLAHRVTSLEEELEESKEDREKIKNALAAINTKLDKQTSFIGGVIFVISCMWGILITFKDVIKTLFSGN